MSRRLALLALSLSLSLSLALPACAVHLHRTEAAAALVRAQDPGDVPYHPLVFQLDLSILAYQLHAQSLVWPFDPFYEAVAPPPRDRDALMDTVRAWAAAEGEAQVAAGPRLEAWRGPGVLTGFEDNPAHDPILYQYSRVHPWSPGLANGSGEWAEYLTPAVVTDPIAEVRVCTREMDRPYGDVRVDVLDPSRRPASRGARDLLLVFEGRRAPRTITVTGRSLGGGLAQHFVSALWLGDGLGPAGTSMPAALED